MYHVLRLIPTEHMGMIIVLLEGIG